MFFDIKINRYTYKLICIFLIGWFSKTELLYLGTIIHSNSYSLFTFSVYYVVYNNFQEL